MIEEIMYGIAALILFIPLAYMLWQFGRIYKNMADTEEVETVYENATIKKHALKHGIDIDKELLKNSMMARLSSKRTFRKEMRNEIMNEMFKSKNEWKLTKS